MAVTASLRITVWLIYCLPFIIGENKVQDDFVDPFDMFNFDPVHVAMINKDLKPRDKNSRTDNSEELDGGRSPVPSDLDKACPPCPACSTFDLGEPKSESSPPLDCLACPTVNCGPTSALFKQYIQQIITLVEPHVGDSFPGSTDVCLLMGVSVHQLLKLRHFAQSLSDSVGSVGSSVHEAHDTLTHMTQGAHRVNTWETRVYWLEERLGVSAPSLCHLAVVLLAALLLLHALRLLRWHQLLPVVFAVSVMFTWFEMFQKEQANQEKIMSESLPKHCPSLVSLPWYDRVANYIGSAFTFQDEKCREFYQATIVNPLFKVNPMEAAAVVMVKAVTSPLEVVGVGVKRFLIGLLKDLPLQHQTYMMVLLALLTLYLPLVLLGYRLRIPFLLAIERSPEMQPTVSDTQGVAHAGSYKAVTQGLGDLPARIAALSLDPDTPQPQSESQQNPSKNLGHPDDLILQQTNQNSRRFTYPTFNHPQPIEQMPAFLDEDARHPCSSIGFEDTSRIRIKKNPFQAVPCSTFSDHKQECVSSVSTSSEILPYPSENKVKETQNQANQASLDIDKSCDMKKHSDSCGSYSNQAIINSDVKESFLSALNNHMTNYETKTISDSKPITISETQASASHSSDLHILESQSKYLTTESYSENALKKTSSNYSVSDFEEYPTQSGAIPIDIDTEQNDKDTDNNECK